MKYGLRSWWILREKAGDGGSGGGGAGGTAGASGASGNAGGTGGAGAGGAGSDPAAELAAARAEIAALKAAAKPPGGGAPDPDLIERTRREKEVSDKEAGRTKQLESALRFGLNAPAFLKQNESLLPKEVADVFKQAEKENFSDAIEKDGAIKSGLIQSFFSVQSNVDMLTAGQKATLDDYLKLTKTGKQDKAQALYDMVFEPAFEMLKRVKRAEALSKGYGGATDSESAYKNKMVALSKKHYLGEKE